MARKFWEKPAVIGFSAKPRYNLTGMQVSTIFSTILIASLAFWLTPRVVHNSQVDIIQPKDIGRMLKQARETDEYWFLGSTARFTRSTTIPELATNARKSNFSKRIKIQILNPDNVETLASYVEYKNRVRRGKKDPWTINRARKELLATILAAYTWRAEEPLLEFEIGLKDSVSFFRIDLSKQLAVITKEDPEEPALKFDNDTFFYNSYLEELRFSLRQSKKLDPNVNGILKNDLNKENVIVLFENLNIILSEVDDEDIYEIITLSKEARNPYE